jgi:hypothetical protein
MRKSNHTEPFHSVRVPPVQDYNTQRNELNEGKSACQVVAWFPEMFCNF